MSKLSPTDSSLEGLLAKLSVAWTGFFAGIQLSDIFTLASLIYVLLNIYVLVRDKVLVKKKHTDSEQDSNTPSGE